MLKKYIGKKETVQIKGQVFTLRQGMVLTCLCEGLSNQEIAKRLRIGEKTVKYHITQIFKTIGVKSRARAMKWAHDRDIRTHRETNRTTNDRLPSGHGVSGAQI